jgi:Holliday junction resolvase RusA-like endonuclease
VPEIEVHTAPVPKARPRLGKGGRVFTPRGTELAEHRIREAWLAAGHGLLAGPLYVEIAVRVPRPLTHYRTSRGERLAELLPSAPRWPAVRPDLDNYAKTALDALHGVAYADDGVIVRLYLAKTYAKDGEVAGWRIGVYAMESKIDPVEDTE